MQCWIDNFSLARVSRITSINKEAKEARDAERVERGETVGAIPSVDPNPSTSFANRSSGAAPESGDDMDVDAGAKDTKEQETADELQAAQDRIFGSPEVLGPPDTVPKTKETSYYEKNFFQQLRK